jgi:hypothetical protein
MPSTPPLANTCIKSNENQVSIQKGPYIPLVFFHFRTMNITDDVARFATEINWSKVNAVEETMHPLVPSTFSLDKSRSHYKNIRVVCKLSTQVSNRLPNRNGISASNRRVCNLHLSSPF